MKKYFPLENTVDPWGNADAAMSLSHVVFETEKKPIFSGILNSKGEKLFSYPEKVPLGFYELKEKSS